MTLEKKEEFAREQPIIHEYWNNILTSMKQGYDLDNESRDIRNVIAFHFYRIRRTPCRQIADKFREFGVKVSHRAIADWSDEGEAIVTKWALIYLLIESYKERGLGVKDVCAKTNLTEPTILNLFNQPAIKLHQHLLKEYRDSQKSVNRNSGDIINSSNHND